MIKIFGAVNLKAFTLFAGGQDMNQVMTRPAKRYSITNFISKFWVISPRFRVMYNDLSKQQSFTTVLAGHIISAHTQESPFIINNVVPPLPVTNVFLSSKSFSCFLFGCIKLVRAVGRAIFFPIKLVGELVKDFHTSFTVLVCALFGHQLEYNT